MSGSCRVFGLAAAIALTALAGCKFPALPDLPEDGAVLDGDSDGTPATDARVRTSPLVSNGQAADLVLGQPSFGTNADRGVTANSFEPEGMAFDAGRLWVADFFRHRVLGWNRPTASDASANYVLGQLDFTTGTGMPTSQISLSQPATVIAFGGRVVVFDASNRAMVWRQPPTLPGAAADYVLGQQNFTDNGPGTGLNQLKVPDTGWTDGTRLFIRGTFTALRMWVWNTFPDATATPADFQMLGGPNVSDHEFTARGGVTSDGQRFVLADTGTNRVLIWNTIPTSSGQPADVVLGQPTFTDSTPRSSAVGMREPDGVLIVDGALFVADSGNDRVLVFDPIPTSSGAPATQVLGQATLSAVVLDAAPSGTSLNKPTCFAVDGNKLFVGDYDNRRILRYDLALP